MVFDGIEWHQMEPNGTKWHLMALNIFEGFQIPPNGTVWHQMEQKFTKGY